MIKLLLSIILTAAFFVCPAKSVPEIKALLAGQDYIVLKKYIEEKSATNTYAFFVIKRDLTSKYQEAVIDINEVFPDSLRPGFASVKTYRVNLIADSATIIYYDFCIKKTVDADWGNVVLKVTDSFRNERSLVDFDDNFKETYNAAADKETLLLTILSTVLHATD